MLRILSSIIVFLNTLHIVSAQCGTYSCPNGGQLKASIGWCDTSYSATATTTRTCPTGYSGPSGGRCTRDMCGTTAGINGGGAWACFSGRIVGPAVLTWCPSLGRNCYNCDPNAPRPPRGPGGWFCNTDGNGPYNCYANQGTVINCPGGTVSAGGICTITAGTSTTYTCPSGGTLSGTTCSNGYSAFSTSCASTPTQTPAITPSRTALPTQTPTQTRTGTQTPTQTSTRTSTRTQTPTPSNTPTQTATNTQTASNTPTPSNTPSNTPTNTGTGTQTSTHTATMSISFSSTQTPTNTRTQTQTPSETQTPTATMSISFSSTQTPTNTRTQTQTPSETQTPTATMSISYSQTQTQTSTKTGTNTQTQTQTPSSTVSRSFSQTSTNTPTETSTQTSTSTNTPSETMSESISPSMTESPSVSASESQSPSISASQSPSTSVTPSTSKSPVNQPVINGINGMAINPNVEDEYLAGQSQRSPTGGTGSSSSELQPWLKWLLTGLSLVLGGTLMIIGALLWRRNIKKKMRNNLQKSHTRAQRVTQMWQSNPYVPEQNSFGLQRTPKTSVAEILDIVSEKKQPALAEHDKIIFKPVSKKYGINKSHKSSMSETIPGLESKEERIVFKPKPVQPGVQVASRTALNSILPSVESVILNQAKSNEYLTSFKQNTVRRIHIEDGFNDGLPEEPSLSLSATLTNPISTSKQAFEHGKARTSVFGAVNPLGTMSIEREPSTSSRSLGSFQKSQSNMKNLLGTRSNTATSRPTSDSAEHQMKNLDSYKVSIKPMKRIVNI
jgi:hypothetical protein